MLSPILFLITVDEITRNAFKEKGIRWGFTERLEDWVILMIQVCCHIGLPRFKTNCQTYKKK
jgi:hypothetical protein